MKKKIDARWTPVRVDSIYCSPACGGKCTYEEYVEAVEGADRLVKALGPAFTGDVWENLGWHYAAQCAGLRVYSKGKKGYRGYTATFGMFSASGTTPRHVVRKIVSLASAQLRDLAAAIGAAEKSLITAGERAIK